MAEEPITTDAETTAAAAAVETDDQRVPYERFQKANQQAKEAKDKATKLERDLADIRAQLEERESAGLPELDRMKNDLQKAAKRAEEAEQRAAQAEQSAQNAQRERWVAAAATNFIDPDDAVRNVDLSGIESAEDAERAVKRVAKAKKHLLKGEEPTLPGRVLQNGRAAAADPGRPSSNIDLSEEARMLSESLKRFATPQ